jgi:hypothetical protein
MAFDPKAGRFAVLALGIVASDGLSTHFLIKMIREVNAVDGQPGKIPWSLIFGGRGAGI